MAATKLRTRQQGKAIVERDPEGALMVMLPDGDIVRCKDKQEVIRRVKWWAELELKHKPADIGLVNLEWREGTFDIGVVPPRRVAASKEL